LLIYCKEAKQTTLKLSELKQQLFYYLSNFGVHWAWQGSSLTVLLGLLHTAKLNSSGISKTTPFGRDSCNIEHSWGSEAGRILSLSV
jgi:hypothetical protein